MAGRDSRHVVWLGGTVVRCQNCGQEFDFLQPNPNEPKMGSLGIDYCLALMKVFERRHRPCVPRYWQWPSDRDLAAWETDGGA